MFAPDSALLTLLCAVCCCGVLQIGLYDVKASVPVVRFVPIFDKQPVPVPLADVMPLSALLAPVGQYKEAIGAMLEMLQPDATAAEPSGGAAAAGAPLAPGVTGGMRRGGVQPGRGFGPTLQAVLEYISSSVMGPGAAPGVGRGPAGGEGAGPGSIATAIASTTADFSTSYPQTRLMVVLAGAPDLGSGKLKSRARPRRQPPPAATSTSAAATNSDGEDQSAAGTAPEDEDNMYVEDVAPSTKAFYEQAAVAAASMNICVDMYIMSATGIGLRVLETLPNSTGGAVYLYPDLEGAMPQDMYR